jgi:hypothetical protein
MRRRAKIYVAAVATVAIAGVVVIRATGGDDTLRFTPPGAYTTQFELSMASLLPKDKNDALNLRLVDRQQHLVADCMHHNSFQYAPVDAPSIIDTTTETDFTSLSYAQNYGFGISSWPRFQPDQSGNNTYRASLSGDALKNYENTLKQCADNAEYQADREYGVSAATERFDAINGQAQRDPRLVGARQAWQSCAQRRGYTDPSRDALIATLRNEYNSVLDVIGVRTSIVGDAGRERRAEQDPRYQRFRQREIAAAVSTFPCSQALDRLYAQIYEQFMSHR